LFFNNITYDSTNLTIPHPLIAERAFVLVPLTDIAPDYTHPILLETVSEMLAGVNVEGIDWFSSGVCGKMEENRQ
jgi:2-amino-4-hydroxy-6-hydroxymethyldihydropteridine diphosphokinase